MNSVAGYLTRLLWQEFDEVPNRRWFQGLGFPIAVGGLSGCPSVANLPVGAAETERLAKLKSSFPRYRVEAEIV